MAYNNCQYVLSLYYVLGTVFSSSLSSNFNHLAFDTDTIIVPTNQIRKLTLSELKQLA